MNLKPGMDIGVVVMIDAMREIIQVTEASVYEIDAKGETITISHPEPSPLKSLVGKGIEITYLVEEKRGSVRYGFPALVKTLVDAYPFNQEKKVPAAVLTRTGKEETNNLRMFYRVEPSSRSNLSMTVQGEPVNILDISIGGARVSHRQEFVLDPYSSPKTVLLIDSERYQVETKIIRTWERRVDGPACNLRFAALQFLNPDVNLERVLSRKIRQIETENLQK